MDNTFIQEQLLPRIVYNPGLALTGFRTTRPRDLYIYVRIFYLHQQEVKFPAVTICNQNAIKNNEIPDHYIDNIFKEIFEVLDGKTKSDEKETGNIRRPILSDILLCLHLSFYI